MCSRSTVTVRTMCSTYRSSCSLCGCHYHLSMTAVLVCCCWCAAPVPASSSTGAAQGAGRCACLQLQTSRGRSCGLSLTLAHCAEMSGVGVMHASIAACSQCCHALQTRDMLCPQPKRSCLLLHPALATTCTFRAPLPRPAEYEASRRMLPPLASSLAYSNYSNWRISHNDQDLPEVTPGVTLTDLYKAAEREVRGS
jgi:hypothetical protein